MYGLIHPSLFCVLSLTWLCHSTTSDSETTTHLHPTATTGVSPKTGLKFAAEPETTVFLQKIFRKYGRGEVITFEGFEHLLVSLGLGDLVIEDHGIEDHQTVQGFKELHQDHNHGQPNTSRDEENHLHRNQSLHRDKEHRHGKKHHRDRYDTNTPNDDAKFKNNTQEDHKILKNNSSRIGRSDSAHSSEEGHSHESHLKELSPDRENDNHRNVNTTRRNKEQHSDERQKRETGENTGSDEQNVEREQEIRMLELERVERTKRRAEIQYKRKHSATAPPFTEKCLTANQILRAYHLRAEQGITAEKFLNLCPSIIYQIDEHVCSKENERKGRQQNRPCVNTQLDEYDHDHDHVNASGVSQRPLSIWDIPPSVWGYASLSVTVISLVGLLGVAVVPVMNRVFYDQLLHFLVALAIGSLTGDALLHLLPHAISIDDHKHGSESGHSKEAVWKGMVALAGIYVFFLMEKLMASLSIHRAKRKLKKKTAQLGLRRVGSFEESLKHLSTSGHFLPVPREEIVLVVTGPEQEGEPLSREVMGVEETMTKEVNLGGETSSLPSQVPSVLVEEEEDHKTGHGHSHGHSHELGSSVASVAWMVIMGDGFHNFTDGLAIGAAFANSLTGGLSTSIAVFCHELPHELGDFAVLLRAGMTIKQALFYNIVSSVLCFLGMILGVSIGNIASASLWIFALAAGMFIYIALVDMLPEIASSSVKEGQKCSEAMVQNAGMITGITIMLLIALYEDQITININ